MTNFFLRDENTLLNIAHRGGALVRPENTLLAFRHALAAGAAALEGDLHATRDGVVVVCHDPTVDRTTDGRGFIRDMTLRELKGLDAGCRFTPDRGVTHPFRGAGLRIPTLKELFGDPVLAGTPMILEIKQTEPSIAGRVLDLVRAHAMESRLIMGSFSRAALEELRRMAAERGMGIVTSLAEEEVLIFCLTPLVSMLLGDYVPPGRVLQVPVRHELEGTDVQVVGTLFMAKAGVLGLKVHVWTVNDPQEMRWLRDEMRADGIITDDPAGLGEVLRSS